MYEKAEYWICIFTTGYYLCCTLSPYRFAESAILHDFLAVLQGALKPKDRQYIIRLTNKQHKLGAGGDVCEKHCKNRVMEGHP